MYAEAKTRVKTSVEKPTISLVRFGIHLLNWIMVYWLNGQQMNLPGENTLWMTSYYAALEHPSLPPNQAIFPAHRVRNRKGKGQNIFSGSTRSSKGSQPGKHCTIKRCQETRQRFAWNHMPPSDLGWLSDIFSPTDGILDKPQE